MLRPRGSLLAALLVLSVSPAFAVTLTVNTTTDDNADNSLCSLREAVAFVNKDRPVAGYQGCKAADGDTASADTISLPANSSPYQINGSAIEIERSVTITGAGIKGDSVTTLKVGAAHRAFVLNFHPTYQEPAQPTSNPSPLAAPKLDPTDTGKTGNNLTTNLTPPIIGTLASAASPAKIVTLYSILADGSYQRVGGTVVALGQTDWSVTPAFLDGLYHLVYTVRDATENEEPANPVYSNQLNLAVYSTMSLTVTMQGLAIQGCNPDAAAATPVNCANLVDGTPLRTSANGLQYINTLTGTANNGGLIYTDAATLTMTNVKLSGGYAAGKGGAIYGDTNAIVSVGSADIRSNRAPDGAAFYIKPNSLLLSNLLLTENRATAGAVVTIESDTATTLTAGTSYLYNMTVSGNVGTALSLSKDAEVNSATIVNNDKGIEFNGKAGKVHNTILAGNPLTGTAQDCSGASAAILAYSLVQAADGCQSPGSATGMQTISGSGTGKLMVDATGVCADQPTGLLCRLADNGGDTLTHLPRILPGTASYAASPFFNQGSPLKNDATSCETSDQRGKGRPDFDCDIGAVELQETTVVVRSGGVISYGQSYTQTLATDMLDEELQPASSCPLVAPTTGPVIQYTPTAKGCPWLEMAPAKGTVTFNADGSYTYRPSSNYHGSDDFTIRVITTYSSLQTSTANNSRLIQASIDYGPAKGISSDSLGSAGGLLLGGLVILGFCARGRRV